MLIFLFFSQAICAVQLVVKILSLFTFLLSTLPNNFGHFCVAPLSLFLFHKLVHFACNHSNLRLSAALCALRAYCFVLSLLAVVLLCRCHPLAYSGKKYAGSIFFSLSGAFSH